MSETISLRNITATPTEERPPLSAFEPDAQTSAPSVERLAGPSVAFEHPPSPVSAPLGLFLELAEPEAENSRSGDLAIPDLDVRPMEHFDSADFGGDGGAAADAHMRAIMGMPPIKFEAPLRNPFYPGLLAGRFVVQAGVAYALVLLLSALGAWSGQDAFAIASTVAVGLRADEPQLAAEGEGLEGGGGDGSGGAIASSIVVAAVINMPVMVLDGLRQDFALCVLLIVLVRLGRKRLCAVLRLEHPKDVAMVAIGPDADPDDVTKLTAFSPRARTASNVINRASSQSEATSGMKRAHSVAPDSPATRRWGELVEQLLEKLVGRGSQNIANTGRPAWFKTEYLEGKVYLRTRATRHAGDCDYFAGKKRITDFQVQLRFLKPPPGIIHVGWEGSAGTPKWGLGTRVLTKVVRKLASVKVPDFAAVWGEGVHPKVAIPFATIWDSWNEHSGLDFEAAPTLCGAPPGAPVTAAIKKSLKREPHEWKMDTIYTMSFYTQYADFDTFYVCNIPLDRPRAMASVVNDFPLRFFLECRPSKVGTPRAPRGKKGKLAQTLSAGPIQLFSMVLWRKDGGARAWLDDRYVEFADRNASSENIPG